MPCIENGIPAPGTNKDCVAPVEKVDYSSYTQRQNSHVNSNKMTIMALYDLFKSFEIYCLGLDRS